MYMYLKVLYMYRNVLVRSLILSLVLLNLAVVATSIGTCKFSIKWLEMQELQLYM